MLEAIFILMGNYLGVFVIAAVILIPSIWLFFKIFNGAMNAVLFVFEPIGRLFSSAFRKICNSFCGLSIIGKLLCIAVIALLAFLLLKR